MPHVHCRAHPTLIFDTSKLPVQMVLLLSKVGTDIIQIIGQWRYDKMLRYLHLTAEPIIKHFAVKMLNADRILAPL